MGKSLKIIIFDGSFKTTPFINRLAQGLAADNEVFILGFNETIKDKIEGIKYVGLGSNQNKFGFLVTTLSGLLKGNSFRKTLKLLFAGDKTGLQKQNLNTAIKNIKPDIIHLQWPSVISWFETILEEQKIPVVLSQRGYHINIRPFINPENFDYLQKWFPKIAGFHSVSKAISEVGDKIYTSKEKIDEVVYTGLNLDSFIFKESYNGSTPLNILSVGRSHWKKGYDYALESCSIIKKKGIHFTYTIVGVAEDKEFTFLIDNLGLTDSVILKGNMKQSEVFQLMSDASVFLLPSIEEGVANVVIESMALGLPVISTDCGGMQEAIIDNKEGWIVPKRNPQAMADSLLSFRNLNIAEILKIRIAARVKVEKIFSEIIMVTDMLTLYNKVLKNKAN